MLIYVNNLWDGVLTRGQLWMGIFVGNLDSTNSVNRLHVVAIGAWASGALASGDEKLEAQRLSVVEAQRLSVVDSKSDHLAVQC